MIKLGSQEVTKIMKGSEEVVTAYKGGDEVWSAVGEGDEATANTVVLFDGTSSKDKTGIHDVKQHNSTYISLNQTGPTPDQYAIYYQGRSRGAYWTFARKEESTLDADFTIEFWVKVRSTSGNPYPCVFGNVTSTFSTGAIGFYASHANGYSNGFSLALDGKHPVGGKTPYSTNVWCHIAIARQGTAMRTFKDGKLVSSPYSSSRTIGSSSYPDWMICNSLNTPGQSGLDMDISNFRIVNGVAAYWDDFTPPGPHPIPERIENVTLLLIGGGGAGGKGSSGEVAGGGGGGGFLEGATDKLFAGVEYSVVIGLGGDETVVLRDSGLAPAGDNDVMLSEEPATYAVRKGGDTSIISPDGIVLANAGGGGRGIASTNNSDRSGASTGGAGLYEGPASNSLSSTKFDPSLNATSVIAAGNRGGTSFVAASNAGGGAGAGQAGGNASKYGGGLGGDGKQSDITGAMEYYAGGGGGGTDNYANGSGSPSPGGQGGGGAGGWWPSTVSIKGTDGLGGGGGGGVGGGGTDSVSQAGAAGGDGAVYIRTEATLSYTGSFDIVNSTEGQKAYRLNNSGTLVLK